MSRTSADEPSSFPRWVALFSLGFVLWLFFANAVPAMRERSQLQAHAAELVDLRDRFDVAITEARLGVGQRVHQDLQALLVAIDQHGFTPAELCAAYPAARPDAAPHEAAHLETPATARDRR
jgi:hypothetical protein